MNFLRMMGIDNLYILLVLPPVILGMIASAMVKSRFNTYNKVRSRRGLSGAQAAATLMRMNGIDDVQIMHTGGTLTDNYNSSDKTLNLSDSTYASNSIAAVAVAAHETGHAIQHKVGYGPLTLRSALYPVANIGSRFGPFMAILGLILGASAQGASTVTIFGLITKIGILLYAAAVAFYIVTLPVEFNASSRALKLLRESSILEADELDGAKKVLTAAALTYVASALTALGSLLRFVLLSRRRR